MTLEELLVTRVTTDPAVVAVIGTRFWAAKVPQDETQPYARFVRIFGRQDHQFGEDSGVEEVVLQIDCFAPTYTQARTGIDAIKARLRRWQDAGDGLDDVFIENDFDDYEEDRDLHRSTIEIRTFYRAA